MHSANSSKECLIDQRQIARNQKTLPNRFKPHNRRDR